MKIRQLLPPPILCALHMLAGWLLAGLPGVQTLRHSPAAAFFAICAAASLALACAAVWQFRRYRTTLNPAHPQNTRHLITSGIFRFTRNPVYLAMVILLAGWSLLLYSLAACLTLPLLVVSLHQLHIRPEEKALREKFPEQWTTWSRRVRRWI
ncbi:methyltransferase family protein [Entomohabitans teleogrylli]|uniref:methyltransferase family protein n=1 Tax=Entomohabitans teleogrylli TaxID=1384589 RepID=UPI00073D5DF2|nr:isoprenylcysteine carboxylmethyltransferase family protein [Entomohabitans teleogrylli]